MTDPIRARVTRWLRLKLPWLVFFLALWLGTRGFLEANGGLAEWKWARFWDALYRSLQMFGLNFDMPNGAGGENSALVNPYIQFARFLAVAVSFYVVLSLFFTSLLDDAKRWLQVGFRPSRHVLLGFGQINQALAEQVRKKHPWKPITAVARSFDEVERRRARALGILLLAGELSDHATLRRARLDRAGRVFVAVGDDLRNIEVATAAAPLVERGLPVETTPRPVGQDKAGNFRLRVHIGDLWHCTDLIEAGGLSYNQAAGFLPFNLKQETARVFTNRAQLVQRARDHGQKRVHLVIVGMGDQGEAILIETLMSAYGGGLLSPKVTVLDREAGKVRTRLEAHYPMLMDGRLASMLGGAGNAEGFEPIDVHPLDVTSTAFSTDPSLDRLDDSPYPPTTWVFACGNDQLNHSAALRLEIAMQNRARKAVPIFVRRWGSGLKCLERDHRNVFGLIEYVGDVGQTIANSPLLEEKTDEMARRIHEAYQAADKAPGNGSERGQGAYRQTWLELPEPVREANRRAARSIPSKLAEMGFQSRDFRLGRLPFLEKALAAEILQQLDNFDPGIRVENSDDTAVLRKLRNAAMIEHSAWIIERAVNGWYQAPSTELKRDNILRRQRNMIRFEDLHPSVAKYDLLTLAVALRALGTGVGTPRAGERTRGCFDLANGYPPFEQIQALTEIELDYNDRSVTDASAATEFAAALKRWSETCPQATRVHLRLATPVVMPTVSLGRKGIAKETDAILHLHAALAALSGEVDCDVTRTYARTAIPTPDEVEPTAGAAG